MPHVRHHLDAFTDISRLPEGEARRTAWRQAMAALSALAADKVPVPLEGADPATLQSCVAWALAEGMLEDLQWLCPAHAASALYELAAALPVGPERRDLGRQVLVRLQEGDAATFVSIAEKLALGTRRGLAGPGIRTRTVLALDLPIGLGTGVDGLALALLARPELARQWLTLPSTGALSARRLAARLVERAAREVLRRSGPQDTNLVSLFDDPTINLSFSRLLFDREPLVWRHVASARGLLSQRIHHFQSEIAWGLDPNLTPTEWRRAAASTAAAVALDPEAGVARCHELLQEEVFRRDPGIAGAMILGLSRVAESEPDVVDALLVDLIAAGGFDAVEALIQLRQERVDANLGEKAAELARQRIRRGDFHQTHDDGRAALVSIIDEELESVSKRGSTLRDRLSEALVVFALQGSREAHRLALEILHDAESLLDRLESCNDGSQESRHEGFFILRELDRTLLETSALSELLSLGVRGVQLDATTLEPIDACFDRLTDWLFQREGDPLEPAPQVEHFTLRLHRLRALLHLVDADAFPQRESGSGQRGRGLRTACMLLGRVSGDAPSPLRRVVAASAARACDALLREEVGELSDVLLLMTNHVRSPTDLLTMAEATMDPVMDRVLQGYGGLVQTCQQASRDSDAGALEMVGALQGLIASFQSLGAPRVEALREALEAYAGTISELLVQRSLMGVAGVDSGSSRIPPFALAAGLLVRLAAGARRRLGEWSGSGVPTCVQALERIDVGVEHALRGNGLPLQEAVSMGLAALREELPLHLAEVAERPLLRLLELPVESPEEVPFELIRPLRQVTPPLPAWMPPSRILGGFYVLRPLGLGAVGSVFVACRSDVRNQRHRLKFALKVPEYGGDVAHTLSHAEFLQLFRDEAGALLAVPQHPNLARLVTFDSGVKPKPILVMELVEGPTLQRLIDTRVLDAPLCLSILDGVAAGLEAMHAVGVGHLDVKPANVILRSLEEASPLSIDMDPLNPPRQSRLPGGADGQVMPVLVDFGLSGRNLRPGCATSSYGAPEVWGHVPQGYEPRPMPADVYAFACLVYETLVGEELFQGSNHLGILTSHLTHDGDPPRLSRLAGGPELSALVSLLRRGLRSDPRNRCTIEELRQGLAGIKLARYPWPIV